MITVDDVRIAYPGVAETPDEKIALWVDVANIAISEDRLREPRTLETAQILFVMHQLTKPPLDIKAPHVRARMRAAGPSGTAPHPWGSTPHGVRLIGAVKY